MRSHAAWRHIPVIMISALTDMDSVVRCIACGAERLPAEAIRAGASRGGELLTESGCTTKWLTSPDRLAAAARRGIAARHPSGVGSGRAQSVTPRRHENVAVLFADIVGFTAFCNAHAPEEIVTVCIYVRLRRPDGGTASRRSRPWRYRGRDAGLLLPNEDPVVACVECAVATLESAHRLPASWDARVGIHGPVVAGVVGRQKFSFDIWGDTVNIAARLAAYGTTPAFI